MSTAALPNFPYSDLPPLQPSFSRTPSYTAEPRTHEQRIALNARLLPRPTGTFVKSSKNGDVTLRLTAQKDNIELPVYGCGSLVEGIVELAKTDNVSTVEVKIEGRLQMEEVAEGGTVDLAVCLESALLWIKDPNNSVCPSTLRFTISLPTTFDYEGQTYPLPPTHSVKLKGLPGFVASIDYSISAIVNKPNSVPNIVPLVKSKKLGIHIGATTVSTPFIYYPRTRPAAPLPSPLIRAQGGFAFAPGWKIRTSVIKALSKSNVQDITVRFYVPASTIFCSTQSIPFHITFESNAQTLVAFLPFGPTTTTKSSGRPPVTRVQLMRQSTVDVRNEVVLGTKTDIFRVDPIGEGSFRHAGDGPTWTSFSGEIAIQTPKVMGFALAGFSVRDVILLTMTPPNVNKSPFVNLRETVPVRLTTDPFSEDGRGIAAHTPPEPVSSPPSIGSNDG
ncbi:hypothetical protein FB45DRAFT_1001079 [Roridomyces roridus]|uniref:Uncharacterized protein n=1 Tax=Roridomyces roridus TaxID=1738132 RepID=A0AAD7C4X9_9AGAR|nr:hypothetical protein FB45DRAFT_1001079 [Roridomyces roridus]